MEITAKMVKQLRDKTGIGMMKCKQALVDAGGDLDKAVELLRKKGLADASKKSERATREGRIGVYVHHDGKLAAMVELCCETDFAANSDAFAELAKDLAMQVASARPRYLSRDDVPEEVVAHEREILHAQVAESGKPPKVIEKIVEGRMKKFYAEHCLLEQPFIKEPKTQVQDLIKGLIAKLGENIVVRRFARLRVGGDNA
jgi:elongation factor Ts